MKSINLLNSIVKPFTDAPAQAASRLLQLLHVKVTATSINDELQNHPDYPSLLSLSDALAKWNVANVAVRVDKGDEDDKVDKVDRVDRGCLPVPFIAYNKTDGGSFFVVESCTKDHVRYVSENTGTVTVVKEKFLQEWSGIALLAEANEQSGEKDYIQKRKAEIIKYARLPLILAILFSLAVFAIAGIANVYELNFVIGYALLLLLKFIGIIVSIFLLWYEVDKTNPSLQRICSGGAKVNCNAILSSKQAKIFKGLSWSEVGFFYFTGGFLLLLFTAQPPSPIPQLTNSPINFITLLNLFALPYTIFSIYYQWRIAKQWCVLCISVQVLLVLEFITAYTTGLLQPFNHITIQQFSQLLPQLFNPISILAFFLPITFWYICKPALYKAAEIKTIKRDLARLKFNAQIFSALMAKQKKITHDTTGLGIVIGNKDAAHTIIKVCNPYCGPCAKAHPAIEALPHETGNVKVQIIFTATADENDSRAKPVKHLLAIAAQQNETLTRQALDDWYLADKKDYDAFAKKYPLDADTLSQPSLINAIGMMHEWCHAEEIEFTPTIFIDGVQMPDVYSVGDLKYFLMG